MSEQSDRLGEPEIEVASSEQSGAARGGRSPCGRYARRAGRQEPRRAPRDASLRARYRPADAPEHCAPRGSALRKLSSQRCGRVLHAMLGPPARTPRPLAGKWTRRSPGTGTPPCDRVLWGAVRAPSICVALISVGRSLERIDPRYPTRRELLFCARGFRGSTFERLAERVLLIPPGRTISRRGERHRHVEELAIENGTSPRCPRRHRLVRPQQSYL